VKENTTTSDNNLVMFPSSKNFPVFDEEILTDPLQELLDEFSDIDIDLDETYDDFEISPVVARGEKNLLTEKIDLLKDTQKRIKFLIDEIELYLPRR
jgi:hypothetical protein